MKLSELGEFGLIDRIAGQIRSGGERVICGIGDDCAVVESGVPGRALLLTTDIFSEGIHFIREQAPPRMLGRKALALNLSDVAAMGGTPTVFAVSLSAPPDLQADWVDALYAGLMDRAHAHGAMLVGGNTSASRQGVSVSVALLGECPTEQIVYRRGARPGEGIFVTGWPGESAAGLAILQAEAKAGGRGKGEHVRETRLEALVMRHLDPEPRLAAGRLLAAEKIASAMIDVSDGVAADLGHILRRSGVGGCIEAAALPLSAPLREAAGCLGLDPATLALTGGEDYELLFTADYNIDLPALSGALSEEVTRIGRITDPGTGLVIRDASGAPITLAEAGYDHFRA